METKTILSERLTELIDKKLDKDYKKTIPIQAQEMQIPYQTLMKYIKGQTQCPIGSIVKIARYYGVSTDYLLGLTPHPTTNTNLHSICEYTGLSEKTISSLNRFKEIDKDMEISHFFESGEGRAFLKLLIEFKYEVVKSITYTYSSHSTSDAPFYEETSEYFCNPEKYEFMIYRLSKINQNYFENRVEEILTEECKKNPVDRITQLGRKMFYKNSEEEN